MTSNRTSFKPKVDAVYEETTRPSPSIYSDESVDHFDTLRREIYAALAPTDAIEKMLVDDVIHYHWEALRHRRLLAKHIGSCEPEGLDALLEGMGLTAQARQPIVNGYANGDESQTSRADNLLALGGNDLETVRARTIALRSEEIGRLQALIGAAEKRRDRSRRELFAHRNRRPDPSQATAARPDHDDDDA